MAIKLTKQQRAELKRLHRHEHGRRFVDRIKSLLLLDDGWSYSEVAKILLLDDQTIRNYETVFSSQGISGLLKTDNKGSTPNLSVEQERALKDHIAKANDSSSVAIIEHIKQIYGIEYSNSDIVKLLGRIGFVYKKTKLVPGKANPERQQQFIREYHQLRAQMSSNNDILFIDGTLPQHNPVSSFAWVLKGKEKEIPTNTGRKRININGALNIDNFEVVVREDERINAQSTIELFKQIEKAYPSAPTIYIIADNARCYRAKIVSEYLKTSRIQFKFLPPYSPNLNLIERLWKFMKKEVINSCYYQEYDIFKKKVMDFFENIKEYRDQLTTLITENFPIIGTQVSKT